MLCLSGFELFSRWVPLYVVASYGPRSFRLFCKNLGNLQEFFGQMVYRPPWQKIARTPMQTDERTKYRRIASKSLFIW